METLQCVRDGIDVVLNGRVVASVQSSVLSHVGEMKTPNSGCGL